MDTTKIQSLKTLLPILLIVVFVVLKIQDLFLQYFWDEAWSYIPAIKAMVNSKPSLLPNSIDPELYRGHPLLFYFLTSSWIRIFGDEIWISKLFPMLTSIALLISVYLFTKKNFDYITAILTLLLLEIQSVFFAQSTFLLPEIILTLFTILSLHYYLKNKRLLTIVFLTLAIFTKESGIVIWGTIIFFEFIKTLKIKNMNNLGKILNLFYYTFPILLILIFFIAQKILVGWYLFPEHVSYLSINSFFERFNGYASYLLIFMGRNALTILGIIALIFSLIKKDETIKEKSNTLYILTLFIVLYITFSSFNFYSPRYLLSILPFTILIFVFFIRNALKKYHYAITILIFSSIIINNLKPTISNRGGHDHTLGYRDLISVQSNMITFCEYENIYDKEIFTHFLMSKNLTNNDLGYLNNDKSFTKVNNKFSQNTEFAIFSSNELNNSEYEQIKNKSIILKRFEKNGCWVELYKIIKN